MSSDLEIIMHSVSAVLFAEDHENVARFYREALGLVLTTGDADHSILSCGGFELVVHQVPRHQPTRSGGNEGPARRAEGRIRLDFPVDSIAAARTKAAELGGTVDDAPPPWAPRDANFYLGHDPEGNVFKLSERAR